MVNEISMLKPIAANPAITPVMTDALTSTVASKTATLLCGMASPVLLGQVDL